MKQDYEQLGRNYGERISAELLGAALKGDSALVGRLWAELFAVNFPAAAAEIRKAGASDAQERAFLLAAAQTIKSKIDAVQPASGGH